MRGQDVVYANLAGVMKQEAEYIVKAMHATGIKRLVFIGSMGIYDEVPGERYRSVLDPYRDSAAVIGELDLDYTILRPGWFTRDDEVVYQITQKGEPFKGHDVLLNRSDIPPLLVIRGIPSVHRVVQRPKLRKTTTEPRTVSQAFTRAGRLLNPCGEGPCYY